MLLIRNNCFETNSSSCHSITIEEFNPKFIDMSWEGRTVSVVPYDFGWEQETYSDFDSKASYLAIYARDWCGQNSESLPEDNPYLTFLVDVIKEFTKAAKVDFSQLFTQNSYGQYEGYIDHQSVEGRDLEYLFDNKNLMKNFLFSDNSYIETDNDNH